MSHRTSVPVLALALVALAAPAGHAASAMCVSHARGTGVQRCVVPGHAGGASQRSRAVRALPERPDGTQHGFAAGSAPH